MAEPKKFKILKGGLNVVKSLFEDGDDTVNAIRSAGRTAQQEQAAVRAAKDAEVASQMANLLPRNKKANEALGLYHPVGGGLKLSQRRWLTLSSTRQRLATLRLSNW